MAKDELFCLEISSPLFLCMEIQMGTQYTPGNKTDDHFMKLHLKEEISIARQHLISNNALQNVKASTHEQRNDYLD